MIVTYCKFGRTYYHISVWHGFSVIHLNLRLPLLNNKVRNPLRYFLMKKDMVLIFAEEHIRFKDGRTEREIELDDQNKKLLKKLLAEILVVGEDNKRVVKRFCEAIL